MPGRMRMLGMPAERKQGRGAQRAINSWESTGRSTAVMGLPLMSEAPYLMKLLRCHPVVLAAGEIFDGFAEVVAMEFGAAFAGGCDERDGDARLEGFGDEGGLAVAGDAFDAEFCGVDVRIGIVGEIFDKLGDAPLPGAEGAPVVGFAGLAFVAEADDVPGRI